jgi:ABC-type phosphate transport system substrate-binding protein
VVLLAGVIAAVTPWAGAQTAGPAMQATPNARLFDGQYLNVTWSGFPASNPEEPENPAVVLLSQCRTGAQRPDTDCGKSQIGITGSDGTGHDRMPVHSGQVASRDNSTSFVCDSDTPCTVAVYVDPTKPIGGPDSASAAVSIAFALPPSGCPHNDAGIAGVGAEGPNRAILAWESAVCRPPTSIDLQFTRTESSDGRAAFVAGPDGVGIPPDFAATSLPLTAAEVATLKEAKRDVAYAPLTASGLAIVFNGKDRVTGQKLSSLTLTPAMVAHILNGRRTDLPTATGNDAESDELLELNPNVNFKPNLQAFGRLDHAAGTWDLTSWLLANASAAWQDTPPWVATRPAANGTDKETVDYAAPTERMPDGLQGPGVNNQLVNGADNLAVVLAGHGQVGNDPETTSIGYLDSSTAAFYGLPTVCLQLDPDWRTSHRPCVQPTSDALGKALGEATRNGDGTVAPAFRPADPSAYPMLDVAYLLAPQGWSDKARAATLTAMLKYAANDGQGEALPVGYAPLPSDLRAHTAAVADSVYAAAPLAPSGPAAASDAVASAAADVVSPATDAVGLGSIATSMAAGITSPAQMIASVLELPVAGPALGPPPAARPATPAGASRVAIPIIGSRLSGNASWTFLIGLSILTGCGLLLNPVRGRLAELLAVRWGDRG